MKNNKNGIKVHLKRIWQFDNDKLVKARYQNVKLGLNRIILIIQIDD
jgi:hypothetical protein